MSPGWSEILSRWSDGDPLKRALRISGMGRFVIMLMQGWLLVKLDVDIEVIALVEALFFIFNICRVQLVSGGRYAGYQLVDKQGFASVFVGFSLLGVLSMLMTLLAMWLMSGDFSLWTGDGSMVAGIALLVALGVPTESYDVHYASRNRPKAIISYMFIVSILQLLWIVGVARSSADMSLMIWGLVTMQALRWLHLMWAGGVMKRRLHLPVAFLAVAAPLILHAFIGGLVDYIDGWMVQAWEGEEAFVYYRYGAREQPLISIFVGAAVSALLLRTSFKSGDIRHEIRRLLDFLGPITLLSSLAAPWLFSWIYAEDFVISGLFFSLYGLLLLSRVIFVQIYYYAEHRRWVLAWITLGELIANVVVSLALYQIMGLWGIPLGTVVVDYTFRALMLFYVCRWKGISSSDIVPWRTHLSYLIGTLVCVCSVFYWFDIID